MCPDYQAFAPEQKADLQDHLKQKWKGKLVIKCNDVVSGNRVKIFNSETDPLPSAIKYATEWMDKGHNVVVEDFMQGREVAMISIVDGRDIIHSPPFRNYKRINDGDQGDNTSGMGTVTGGELLPFMNQRALKRMQDITEKFYDWTKAKFKERYLGSLYGEFLVQENGDVKLIEYNNRFGNPSSMNLLLLMKPNFGDVCQAIVEGKLGEIKKGFWHEDLATVSAYVVPNGFPNSRKFVGRDFDIGLTSFESPTTIPEEMFYCGRMDWSGTGDGWYVPKLAHSRAFAVVAKGKSIEEARKKVYAKLPKNSEEVHFRKDIGKTF